MWFERFELKYKKSKLDIEIPLDYYSKPCTEEEFNAYHECTGDYETTYKKVNIPNYLRLTNELEELLKRSNGGVLSNQEREFKFFDMETIRYFYIYYGFVVHHPNYLPIAFSEELYFYLYKFENKAENPKIYAISLYDIGDENEMFFIGNSLEEMMLKSYSLEDEISKK